MTKQRRTTTGNVRIWKGVLLAVLCFKAPKQVSGFLVPRQQRNVRPNRVVEHPATPLLVQQSQQGKSIFVSNTISNEILTRRFIIPSSRMTIDRLLPRIVL
jgi:hypothetical protein